MENSRNLIESLDITSSSSFPGALIPLTKLYFFQSPFHQDVFVEKTYPLLAIKRQAPAVSHEEGRNTTLAQKYYSGFFHLM